MRHLTTVIFALLIGLAPAWAKPDPQPVFATTNYVLGWIDRYLDHPEPVQVPAAYHALSHFEVMKDPETSGVYVGFLAGVLGADSSRAPKLVDELLPLPFEDQWVLIDAIAYSGLPDWQDLLRRAAPSMTARHAMIEDYLTGKLPPLEAIPLEIKTPGTWETLRGFLTFHPKPPNPHVTTFDTNPQLLDVLWGQYFATGSERPVDHIIAMLAWSKEPDNVDRLTIGSMAKYTLVTNASRGAALLALLERANGKPQPKPTIPPAFTGRRWRRSSSSSRKGRAVSAIWRGGARSERGSFRPAVSRRPPPARNIWASPALSVGRYRLAHSIILVASRESG